MNGLYTKPNDSPPSLASLSNSTRHTNIKGVIREFDSITNQIHTINKQKRELDRHKKQLENQIIDWLKSASQMEVIYGENIYFINYKEKRKLIQKKIDKQEKREETIQTLRNSGVDDSTLKRMFENGLDFKFQESAECTEELKVRRIKN